MRILLFLLTNLAVMLVVGVVWRLLGFESLLQSNGVDLNFNALLVFCGLFGMLGSLFSLFISKWSAKRGTGTRIIETPANRDEEWLVQTVRQLADNAGIGMPEVGIWQSEAPNAFATGWNRNNALVAVSTGLLKRMKPDEVRAVMAHEIGHVANGDMITLALVQGVVNTFVMFFSRVIGHTIDRVIFKNERGLGMGYWIGTFFAQILLSVLAAMIVMWFSRYREYRADAAGADLAGRMNMIAALRRLKAESERPSDLPGELTAFGISPGGSSMRRFFASHPPLDQRIEALQNR
ncbi:protease HtpX [Luminiphilus sp.]|nr:protease HtpX [Luminiphilus sp.]